MGPPRRQPSLSASDRQWIEWLTSAGPPVDAESDADLANPKGTISAGGGSPGAERLCEWTEEITPAPATPADNLQKFLDSLWADFAAFDKDFLDHPGWHPDSLMYPRVYDGLVDVLSNFANVHFRSKTAKKKTNASS